MSGNSHKWSMTIHIDPHVKQVFKGLLEDDGISISATIREWIYEELALRGIDVKMLDGTMLNQHCDLFHNCSYLYSVEPSVDPSLRLLPTAVKIIQDSSPQSPT